MVIRGKVFDVIKVNDTVTQVIIMVKRNQGYSPVCLCAYDGLKSLVNQINLQKKDIIKAQYFVVSRKHENKYYTTAVLEKIVITEKGSPQLTIDM